MKILLAVDGSKPSLDAVDCLIEHADWYRDHDPVLIYARRLLASDETTQEALAEMDGRTRQQIAEAREFALESPRPTPESALDHVFA